MIVTNLLGKVVEIRVSPIIPKTGCTGFDPIKPSRYDIPLGSRGRICNVFLFNGSPYYTVYINGTLLDMAPSNFKLSDFGIDDDE